MYSGVFKSTLPRPANTSQIDALTTLRAYDAAAISATTNGTPIEYPFTAEESVKVIINQAAYSSYSAGTAEWTLSLQVSNATAGTYVTIATILPALAAGAASNGQEVFLSGEQINKAVSGARFLRIVATKTGSPGNLTFGSYVVPSDC
jgi:hypothetical protein